MWTPADITALPTPKDLILASQAIRATEEELKIALIALADAQRRVANLEEDLVRRRVWIAPIRRLNLDVLSLIFEFCGEDQWETTLRISEVSRRWRSIVLATPRAWAFLELNDFEGENHVIDRFFQRSAPRPLHVFAPDHTVLLCNMGSRLKCLSILDMHGFPEDSVFSVLDRLTIRYESTLMEISYFNDTRFPSLRHLVCEPLLMRSREDSSGFLSWTCPPLQTLSVLMTPDQAWFSLLNACSRTLISLKLNFQGYRSQERGRITLPVLRCLELEYRSGLRRLWPLDLKTPLLECYLESNLAVSNDLPYHRDAAAVKQMRLDYAPSLASFPLLERLQLDQESRVSALFSQLALNNTLSPKLQKVEFARDTEGLTPDLEKELDKVNQHGPVPIKLVTMRSLAKDLPCAITNSPCGEGMPCSGDRWP